MWQLKGGRHGDVGTGRKRIGEEEEEIEGLCGLKGTARTRRREEQENARTRAPFVGVARSLHSFTPSLRPTEKRRGAPSCEPIPLREADGGDAWRPPPAPLAAARRRSGSVTARGEPARARGTAGTKDPAADPTRRTKLAELRDNAPLVRSSLDARPPAPAAAVSAVSCDSASQAALECAVNPEDLDVCGASGRSAAHQCQLTPRSPRVPCTLPRPRERGPIRVNDVFSSFPTSSMAPWCRPWSRGSS